VWSFKLVPASEMLFEKELCPASDGKNNEMRVFPGRFHAAQKVGICDDGEEANFRRFYCKCV